MRPEVPDVCPAQRPPLRPAFAEMNGENMLLMNDIGFWDFVRTEKMPPLCAGGRTAGKRREAFLATFSATVRCGDMETVAFKSDGKQM